MKGTGKRREREGEKSEILGMSGNARVSQPSCAF
jgi:hypothetical protein